MHHHYIDQLSFGKSYLHRFDPRSKLIGTLLLILSIVTMQRVIPMVILCSLFVLGLGSIIGKLPLIFTLKRTMVVLPFVLLIALVQIFVPGTPIVNIGKLAITQEGIKLATILAIKAILCIYAVLLLISTTRFADILQGLATWKVPIMLLSVISFLYRYLFVLVDETMILKRAMDSRAGNMPRIRYLNYFGKMLGILFVRTYLRADRIYQAMLARGYDGKIHSFNLLKWEFKDTMLIIIISIIIAFGLWGSIWINI